MIAWINHCKQPNHLLRNVRPITFFSLCHFRFWVLLLHLLTINNTYTLGKTPLEKGSARRRIFTRENHPCPQLDSNPQSQEPSGRRPTPCNRRLPRSAARNWRHEISRRRDESELEVQCLAHEVRMSSNITDISYSTEKEDVTECSS